ncbi:hypothetical protein K449DRAFT_62576 [Hypoxylon sp. EC38]|nr:hypothetical protein K449DRAFT_62576 [Hypoxylon sp. EC38]
MHVDTPSSTINHPCQSTHVTPVQSYANKNQLGKSLTSRKRGEPRFDRKALLPSLALYIFFRLFMGLNILSNSEQARLNFHR